MAWGTAPWGQVPWGGRGAIAITVLEPRTLDARGGELVRAVGTFPVGAALSATLGSTGTAADAACGSGVAGRFGVLYSTDGTTLYLVTPAPLARGVTLTLRVTLGSIVGLALVNAVEGMHCARLHSMRRLFASSDATGPRTLAEEPTL